MIMRNLLSICGLGFAAANGYEGGHLSIPYLSSQIVVDGKLDEDCYKKYPPLVDTFVVAGDKTRISPATKAWVFWNEEQLIYAYSCEDSSPASAPKSDNKQEVNGQDRGEIFLWNGDPDHSYYCFEIAPLGAILDYKAEFYRKFDDTWSPAGEWEYKTLVTPKGYSIEMVLSRESIEAMGLKLQTGERFRIGLFRADYDKYNGTPTWITWIDRSGEPDFHVSESFGMAELKKK
jgi:hypothetical protein